MINKPINPETIKQLMNFPQPAKFLGFVIYFPENDEYLHYFEDNEMVEQCGYSKVPNLAIIYRKQKEAFSKAKKIQYQSVISMLFEDSFQYFVAHDYQNIIRILSD